MKMNKFQLAIILLPLLACNSVKESPEESVFFQNQESQWITDGRELPVSDSLFYLNRPSPHFRKEFKTESPIKNATLSITAAGYYSAFLNGNRIGENVLDPAWTDFSKRIYYTEYDVSALIEKDINCIGVSLGNGFYNPLPLKKWGRRNLRADTKVGKPTFLAKLLIEYENGRVEEVVSDTTWQYAYGPLTKNSVYIGVVYDARLEIEGWNTPGYNTELWESAQTADAPGGILQKSFFPPVQITGEITPEQVYATEPGLWIVDMGVNFTGTYKIRINGNIGDTINFRFGERVYDDGQLNPMTTVIGQIKRKGVGGAGAPDIAWQTDRYIIGANTGNWFKPEFTYHTYRYMEVSGVEKKPQISDIKGLAIHTNVTNENSFSSSSELLNSIQEMTERTFLSNLISVQSDCPAREKFGYGGDLNATSESYIYNFDMQEIYRKTVYDWVDAMNDSTFVDTAPFVGISYCGVSWESAYLLTQYYLYLYYNDTEIVKELYELNNQWMDKVARIHPDGIVDEGLSDHESLEPVPVQLTGTSHYLQCAKVMQTFASVMDDQAGSEKYKKLAEKLKGQVQAKYWDQSIDEEINRQTLFSTLLYHQIVPADEVEAARDSLLRAVANGPSSHFNTGIFGTKYVLETLSENSSPSAVFDIVNSTAYPGWGHMIDKGATTLWETWKESDNTYSNNHPMFGAVSEWYYRWLGGIRPDPEYPGFKQFTLAPNTPEGLEYVKCTYHSPFGPIVSNWNKAPSGDYRYEISIPQGSVANMVLPMTNSDKIEITKNLESIGAEDIEGLQSGKFQLDAGEYMVTLLSQN